MCKGMLMGVLEFPILTSQSILRHIGTALIFLTLFCCSTSYNIQDSNCIALRILILTKFWPTDQIRSWCELTMEGEVCSEEKKLWGKFIEKCFTCFSRRFCFVWNYVTKQVIGHRKINNLKALRTEEQHERPQNLEDWRPTRASTKPWELESSTNFHKTLKTGDDERLWCLSDDTSRGVIIPKHSMSYFMKIINSTISTNLLKQYLPIRLHFPLTQTKFFLHFTFLHVLFFSVSVRTIL